MLRLVVPVSAADVHLLPSFVGVLRHLGLLGNHQVSFVPAPSVVSEATQAANDLQVVANGNIGILPLNEEPHGGWPLAPNQHFKKTVALLDGIGNDLPWFWCEIDQTPLVTGWLDQLDAEYQRAVQELGKIYMGTVVPTRLIGMDGRVIQDHPEYAPHMVGSGIYPAKFSRLSGWVYPAIMVNKPETAEVVSFDIQMRDEVRPKCHDTKLMQHMWSTVNYHQNGVGIVCDDKPGNPWGTTHCGAIRDGVVIVHGCKDGSLAALVTGKKFSGVDKSGPSRLPHKQEITGSNPVPATINASPKLAEAVNTSLLDRLKDVERRMAELEYKMTVPTVMSPSRDPFEAALLAGLEQASVNERVTKDAETTKPPKPDKWAKKAEPTAPDTPEPLPMAVKIVEMLKASPKALRLSHVMRDVNLSKEAVIALSSEADSEFVVTGAPACWVKLKTLAPA